MQPDQEATSYSYKSTRFVLSRRQFLLTFGLAGSCCGQRTPAYGEIMTS